MQRKTYKGVNNIEVFSIFTNRKGLCRYLIDDDD